MKATCYPTLTLDKRRRKLSRIYGMWKDLSKISRGRKLMRASTYIEEMLQESSDYRTMKYRNLTTMTMANALLDTLESGAYTDLIIECKLPSSQLYVAFQLVKQKKHLPRIIELSLRLTKHGSVQYQLLEKNAVYIHLSDEDLSSLAG